MSGLWVKQIALHNVGRPHPISWRPELNKMTDLPQARENSQHPAFGLQLQHWLALSVATAQSLQLELWHRLSWVSSLPAQLADFRLATLCDCVSQFLKRNPLLYKYIYIYTHPIGSVSLKNPKTASFLTLISPLLLSTLQVATCNWLLKLK